MGESARRGDDRPLLPLDRRCRRLRRGHREMGARQTSRRPSGPPRRRPLADRPAQLRGRDAVSGRVLTLRSVHRRPPRPLPRPAVGDRQERPSEQCPLLGSRLRRSAGDGPARRKRARDRDRLSEGALRRRLGRPALPPR
ncbi:MAG: hypothetical protein MZU97_13360 [Bacillus subtilis]|nr:hypothetical protein [Bacillus subtilis]